MYFARIRKTQSWHLLSYALDLMTAGVAVAKQTPTSGWVPMKFPQRISTMSRTRMSRDLRKRVGVAIGQKSHVSARRAQQLYFPLIRFAYEHSPEKFEQIAAWLEAKDELNEMLSAELS